MKPMKKEYLVDVPVAVQIWIRPEAQRKQFEILREARPSTLLIISDGGRNEEEKRLIQISRTMFETEIDWECSVNSFYSDVNLGTYGCIKAMHEFVWSHVDRCIFSFVEMYQKLRQNFPELKPIGAEDREVLACGLGGIAAAYGIPIQTCGNNGLWPQYGIATSGCTTLDMLGKANGVQFKQLKHKGQRVGCGCFESRDIGAYNSCPNGCRYCYANKDPERALRNWREEHDPQSPLLLGHLSDGDEISFAKQRSHMATGQGSLF